MESKPKGKPRPSKNYPGAFEQQVYYDKFPTQEEALQRCKELQEKETDPRYSFVPISQLKVRASSYACGVSPWSSEETDRAVLEDAHRLESLLKNLEIVKRATTELSEILPFEVFDLYGDHARRRIEEIKASIETLNKVAAKLTEIAEADPAKGAA
jgi:hypothetical protein